MNMNTIKKYQIRLSKVDGSRSDYQSFEEWIEAYEHYNSLVNEHSLKNAQYTCASDMDLVAGGKGYEYLVCLDFIEFDSES